MHSGTAEAVLRTPKLTDAAAVHDLIRRCPPLDVNSSYAYLLLAHHFADTCVVAEREGELAGFVSGYRPPGRGDTLFVWQVAVDESARGCGLGRRMVLDLLARREEYRYLETTVSPSNAASHRMFEGVASALETGIKEKTLFTRDHLGEVDHEEECLLTIGPFGRSRGEERERGESLGDRKNRT